MHLNSLVAKARRYCQAQGARLTPMRETVFKLIARQKQAIGAYDLLDKLRLVEPGAKPATVYRALDFLIEQGFVHKIESTNSFIFCHHFDCSHPVQFLICDRCGNVQEIQSANVEQQLVEQARAAGFTIHHQTIEAHGLCQACYKKEC